LGLSSFAGSFLVKLDLVLAVSDHLPFLLKLFNLKSGLLLFKIFLKLGQALLVVSLKLSLAGNSLTLQVLISLLYVSHGVLDGLVGHLLRCQVKTDNRTILHKTKLNLIERLRIGIG